MQGHDTLALLPTGGGKSLCYQLPAVAKEGLCLVVSPLIALMRDQVQQLLDRGIRAACIVSGMSLQEQEVVLNNAVYGRLKLLYVSPERLKNQMFVGHLRQMRLSLIAVDEAHCISQWGYDFRPSFLDIVAVRRYFPSVPFLALTASATPSVAADIAQVLAFRPGYQMFKSGFLRPNLAYMSFHEPDKNGRLLRVVNHIGGSGIVYVRNRRRTQEVAQFLTANHVSATFYHAGLSAKERDLRQLQWMRGGVSVMVATNAFGMGVDKPDVRFVVHLDLPDCIESYYQEAGRAGRDGQKAYALILYDESDIHSLRQSFEVDYPSVAYVQNVYRAICNYYQIPLGSGEGCLFDFDFLNICQTYGFHPHEFYSAVRLIEKEGLVSVPDREEAESRLFICVSNETLYRFQVDHVRYEPLIQQLLRNYGGLFTDFVPINEKLLARKCYLEESMVEKMLLHLDALKLVSYRKRSSKPPIEFVSVRVDATSISLCGQNYHQLKQRASERLEAMVAYATARDVCRSQALLSYFGDMDAEACHICDVCIGKRNSSPDLRQTVETILRRGPATIDEVVAQVHSELHDEKTVVAAVREMIDRRQISIDKDFRLTLSH